MKNNMFDYSWHYSKWHTDTEQSRSNDIGYAKWLYETQGIYPPPPSAIISECLKLAVVWVDSYCI